MSPALQEILTTTTVPPPPRPVAASARVRARRPRSMQIAIFFVATAWFLLSRTIAESGARGLSLRFGLTDGYRLVEAIARLFLVVLGLAALSLIERRAEPRTVPLSQTLGLPVRLTARREWALGAALGWGLAVGAVLLMALARALNVHLWGAPRAWFLVAIALAALAVSTLASVLGVYGYGFHRLIEAIGPTRASLLVVLLSAVYAAFDPASSSAAVAAATVGSLLLCLSWLRTHGLWIAWGLSFAWAASVAILFGLPLAGQSDFASVVDTRAIGRAWLTGGHYGPGAALVTILLLFVAIPILIRATSDYAWDYTRPPILSSGIEVNVPAPAAHAAYEDEPVPKPGGLVQILPVAPAPPIPPSAGSTFN